MIDLEPGWMMRLGSQGTVLSLLLLGHVLADFVFQSDAMVERKKTLRGLLMHGLWLTLIQALAIAPYASLGTVPVILTVAALHLLVDAAKIRVHPRTRLKASLFLGDQAAHATILFAAWWVLVRYGLWTDRFLPVDAIPLSRIAFLVAAFAFAWNGGSALVRELLQSRDAQDLVTPNQMGKLIGALERWIVVALVLLSQWTAIAFVFTAKSIARFEQLGKREFAEYYLVGTLASLVVGAATGLACAWALGL